MKHLITISLLLFSHVLFSQGLGTIKNLPENNPNDNGPDHITLTYEQNFNRLIIGNLGQTKTILTTRITNVNSGESTVLNQNIDILPHYIIEEYLHDFPFGLYEVKVIYCKPGPFTFGMFIRRATLRIVIQ